MLGRDPASTMMMAAGGAVGAALVARSSVRRGGVVLVSMKTRYGVRALVGLAQLQERSAGRPVPLADIATEREIPAQYLEQLLASLRRAGVVRSHRGAAGGYSLKRSTDDITLLEVLELLDGKLAVADCLTADCERVDRCGPATAWAEAQAAFEEVLARTTIADLVDRERKRAAGSGQGMYYI